MTILDIKQFSGKYRFLSNFSCSYMVISGIKFKTVEAAFQAAKTLNPKLQVQISRLVPAEAKKLGRMVELRPDWENIKLGVMASLIHEKFKHQVLRQKLIDTGDVALIEGNIWHDTFWGVCQGVGENHLGKILMKERDEINKPKKLGVR